VDVSAAADFCCWFTTMPQIIIAVPMAAGRKTPVHVAAWLSDVFEHSDMPAAMLSTPYPSTTPPTTA
jgi:hypothetical protein